jgi:hypothetical protein
MQSKLSYTRIVRHSRTKRNIASTRKSGGEGDSMHFDASKDVSSIKVRTHNSLDKVGCETRKAAEI